jgi:hypothetical protein
MEEFERGNVFALEGRKDGRVEDRVGDGRWGDGVMGRRGAPVSIDRSSVSGHFVGRGTVYSSV